MSSRSDFWWHDRLRFYREWHDNTLRLACYDKLGCSNNDFNFALSEAQWREFASQILKACDKFKGDIYLPDSEYVP